MTDGQNQHWKADDITRGISITVLAVLIFGSQDAISKVLVQTWSPFQISMMRYWAFGVFSLFLVWRRAPLHLAFQTRMPVWQIARGVLLMLDIWLFALAIRTVPLAELGAISLIYPLLVTLFAILVLNERVGPFRLAMVFVGFCGALVIIRPGGMPLDLGLLFAVLSATCYAAYIICTRKVAKVDSTATSMVYVGVIGMVMSSAVGVFFWEPMDLTGILLVAVLMVMTISAHGLMMVALSYAPASVLQPFNYLSLPWAITLSFIVFGHLIDFISLLGALVIVAAGLAIWARERKKAK